MWDKGINVTNRQKRITVNFRLLSEEEQKVYEWIKANGVVGGDSAFVKTILYKAYKEYLEEQEGK